MLEAIDVRKAQPEDTQVLAQIAYTAWETGILPLLTERPGMRQTEQRRLTNVVNETVDRIIVALCDGEPVGWCSRARGRPYITFLFVAPAFQGHGIGALLLQRMEALLELEGQGRVVLETPADNVRAVRFYERQGYHILALKTDGRSAHEAFMSVRLEKLLRPYVGPVPDIE